MKNPFKIYKNFIQRREDYVNGTDYCDWSYIGNLIFECY